MRARGTELEIDIIFVTGFDAVTGALTRIDIRGHLYVNHTHEKRLRELAHEDPGDPCVISDESRPCRPHRPRLSCSRIPTSTIRATNPNSRPTEHAEPTELLPNCQVALASSDYPTTNSYRQEPLASDGEKDWSVGRWWLSRYEISAGPMVSSD